MTLVALSSDQLYNWSAYDEKEDKRCSAAPQKYSFYSCHEAWGIDSQRIAYRALQALWKVRLQMCRWTRAWTKVLSIYKSTGQNTRNGLRPYRTPRQGEETSQKLLLSPRVTRGDLCNQSRTAASSGGILERYDSVTHSADLYRYCRHKHCGCQHATNVPPVIVTDIYQQRQGARD